MCRNVVVAIFCVLVSFTLMIECDIGMVDQLPPDDGEDGLTRPVNESKKCDKDEICLEIGYIPGAGNDQEFTYIPRCQCDDQRLCLPSEYYSNSKTTFSEFYARCRSNSDVFEVNKIENQGKKPAPNQILVFLGAPHMLANGTIILPDNPSQVLPNGTIIFSNLTIVQGQRHPNGTVVGLENKILLNSTVVGTGSIDIKEIFSFQWQPVELRPAVNNRITLADGTIISLSAKQIVYPKGDTAPIVKVNDVTLEVERLPFAKLFTNGTLVLPNLLDAKNQRFIGEQQENVRHFYKVKLPKCRLMTPHCKDEIYSIYSQQEEHLVVELLMCHCETEETCVKAETKPINYIVAPHLGGRPAKRVPYVCSNKPKWIP